VTFFNPIEACEADMGQARIEVENGNGKVCPAVNRHTRLADGWK